MSLLWDSTTNKKQNMADNFRVHLPFLVPAHSAQRRMFRKNLPGTYLALIAAVLQGSPHKMLTFSQLMDELEAFVSGDRKGFENNIRVCLSTNKCFVKIPMNSEMSVCKRNYWKFDHNQVTAKMVRRHFKGILDQFPELACKVGMETTTRPPQPQPYTTLHPPEPAACKAVQIRCEVKFSSPFSIESLLKRDGPCGLGSKASPLSSVPVPVEQRPRSTERGVGTKRTFSWDSPPVESRLLQGSGGSSLIYTTGGNTDHELTANAAAKRMCITEPSFLIYTRPSVAPYVSSPQSSYITYPTPAHAHDVHHFYL